MKADSSSIEGKHLIRRLLSSNIPITVVDNDELEAIHRDFPRSKSLLGVIIGDIRDKDAMRNALGPDVIGVLHLAAVSRVLWCLQNEPDCEDVNVAGTKGALESMEKARVGSWFIQASSREVYGVAEAFPVTEDVPHNTANVYGASKARAETAIEQHILERDGKSGTSSPFRAIALRLSNIYGGQADHRKRLIPSITTNALAHRTIQIVGGDQDVSFSEHASRYSTDSI